MVRRSTRILLATTAALATVLAPALPAQAAPTASARVVATGLDNPRQLTIGPGGAVYVAEAGRGGESDLCIPNPEDANNPNCLGATGAVTRIANGTQTRVLAGLPSIAGPGGGGAQGPADVAVTGNHIAVLFGLGGAPAVRDDLGVGGALLGTVAAGPLGGPLTEVADPVAHEAVRNPHKADLDSNPSGLLAIGRSGTYLVADAGGNDVVSVGRRERTTAVFADRMVASPFPGMPPRIPMQSVPTDVVEGPDGALHVSELTGFPFPAGGAVIWRVVPGQEPSVYASGLTSVTSLAWRGSTLYAVQLSDTGLLGGMTGSLRRITPRGTQHPVVADGLFAPYGVAIHGNTAYVSLCSVCAGGGEVRALPLR